MNVEYFGEYPFFQVLNRKDYSKLKHLYNILISHSPHFVMLTTMESMSTYCAYCFMFHYNSTVPIYVFLIVWLLFSDCLQHQKLSVYTPVSDTASLVWRTEYRIGI